MPRPLAYERKPANVNAGSRVEIPKRNHLVDPDRPHMEIVDTETRVVWQSVRPEAPVAYSARRRRDVHVIGGGADKQPIALPHGWTLPSHEVTEERTIHLPHPPRSSSSRTETASRGPSSVRMGACLPPPPTST